MRTTRNGSATGLFRGCGEAGKLSFARDPDGDSGKGLTGAAARLTSGYRKKRARWMDRAVAGNTEGAANHDRGMAGMKQVVNFLVLGANFRVLADLLFVPAGTLAWPAGWAILILISGPLLLMTRALARDDPALFGDRMKPPSQKGLPVRDRIYRLYLASILIGSYFLSFCAGGFRWWSATPAGLRWLGAAGILISMWIMFRKFQANPFCRNYAVVTKGPYGYVRQPLFAATLLLLASAGLMLGSWFGFAAMILPAGVLSLCAAWEDRELHRSLDGYADYAERLRYRLVPWVW
jgi:protein-S-isoprenylcysteine O-methyltransferase Ste14